MALGRRQTLQTAATLPALRRAVDDASAFDELYDEMAERVLVYFTRRVLDGQIALDLTGETFAIARSQVARYWRRGRVEREALERLGVEVPVMGDAELERVDELAASAQVRAQVARELGRLPADQRDALQAHVVDERPYDELSREWGVSEQTIRARVSRGLRSLGATLDAPVTEHVP